MDTSTMSQANDERRWNSIKKRANEARALKAFDLFRGHGIEPILIKGLAAAAAYPEGEFRDAIDLDLAVDPASFEKALPILDSPAASNLHIDLHRGLRDRDTFEWNDLFANSRLLDLENGSIRVLREEDHLRVLCVHWLIDGGVFKDRLFDISYAIQNRAPDFDWDRFLLVETRRRRWLICAVGIAQRMHELDLSGTPMADAAKTVPGWVWRTLKKEWSTSTPFLPLRNSVEDFATFRKQLKKRFPPNPITATVLSNGSIDSSLRLQYQFKTVIARALPSVRDVGKVLFFRDRKVNR